MGFGKNVVGRKYTIVIDEEYRQFILKGLEADRKSGRIPPNEERDILEQMFEGLPDTDDGDINDFTA